MQHELRVRNADSPADCRLQFRMGVSLGNIVIDGEQPHGDGINIAVRIKALVEPGSILIAGSVYEHVKCSYGMPFVLSLSKHEYR
jgi:adenylate cyclase